MENKENLISSNNYCNDTGKNLKALQTKSLKNEKLIENNCSKCGENVQATYNYCNNCGAAKEVIGSKSGIKNIDFTKKELPDFKVPEIKSVGSIDIIYILKAVGIISLIGLLTGLLLTVLVLRKPLDFMYDYGLFSYDTEGFIASSIFSVGLFLWRFVTFIPLDYGYDQFSIFNTFDIIGKIESMNYGGIFNDAISAIKVGIFVLFVFAIGMIIAMFIFGMKLAKKYKENYLTHAAIFSGIYSLVLCITLKNSMMQSIITVAIVSFVSVFLGCKYAEMKSK